jgi:hypothetical protein
VKGGTNSPENFLAYFEFDGTFDNGGTANNLVNGLHHYSTHVQDWKPGNPSWQNGKGKGIVGAMNYFASQEMNSICFLTFNITGDADDVWPYISPNSADRERFDVSKLDQWEILFSHMDSLGIHLQFLTQERENEMLLDAGNVGTQRRLYYRELIARFGHHLAITWNLGQENGRGFLNRGAQNNQQRKDMATYFKTHDPYKGFVDVHAYDNPPIYTPLLGYPDFDGIAAAVVHGRKGLRLLLVRSRCDDRDGPRQVARARDRHPKDVHSPLSVSEVSTERSREAAISFVKR